MLKVKKRSAIIIAVILISAVCAALVSCGGGEKNADKPVFTPPPFDGEAVPGAPSELDEAFGYGVLELKEGFVVAVCGFPAINDENGTLDVYFTSDADNTVWVRLLILSGDGDQLGATGILKPGEYVKSVHITDVTDAGGGIVYKIVSYEPDTYYSMGTATVSVTPTR